MTPRPCAADSFVLLVGARGGMHNGRPREQILVSEGERGLKEGKRKERGTETEIDED